MEEEKKFWMSKVWGIQEKEFFSLIKKLNEFYKNKFIIATQVFHGDVWSAIVYYKKKP